MSRPLGFLLLFLFCLPATANKLSYTEQLPIEAFKKLREVERHQIRTAEKLSLRGEFAAAANEYEKYLTLYEQSAAAPYAQLMWSHCLVRQRKGNTAIRDGFQSVIDYWPDSHEAVLGGRRVLCFGFGTCRCSFGTCCRCGGGLG